MVKIKLLAVLVFVAGVGTVLLFGDNSANQSVHAFSAGPPAGYTRAPGEEPEACAECHVVESAGTGRLTLNVPQTYVPGRTYDITVTHANADQTRVRWGFQLTALDASEAKAGTLTPLDNLTRVLDNQGPFPDRQYIEHTSQGTFFGQRNGASWTFRWTAPADDVGPVTFYAAGNQANGDGNTSGDNIYFTFVASTFSPPTPDFNVTVTPATRTTTPGGTALYNVNVTPTAGFTGNITLGATNLPANSTASFNPPVVSINDAGAKSSTLTITTGAATPLGSFQFNVTAASGALQRSATSTVVVASPASADLSVSVTDSPDPADTGASLSYRVEVTNNGPAAATNVSVADTLPAGVTFVSATPSQGTCAGTTNVNCALGTLAVGATANVTLVVQPQSVGTLANTATATATQSDPISSNNSATATTTVVAPSSGPRMLVPDLGVRTVVVGLSQPTSMAFIGPDDFLILEKESGKVKRVRNGAVEATVLDLPVNSASERGLLGIALHPRFASNGFVYLYWTESSTGADTTAIDAVPLLGNRIDRFTWNGSVLLPDPLHIMRLRALQQDAGQPSRGNHNGGVLRFGPDGKLYVFVGDLGRRGLLQNLAAGGPVPDDQFGGPEPNNAHLSGVILRLNDDGTTPTDNPFFNANTGLTGEAAANVRKIFAYGVRNGFGMDFDPVGGALWTQENGDDSFDELNRVTAGFNGGWIQLMGPSSRVAEFKQIETSRAGGLQQTRWPPSNIADTPAAALARLFNLPGSVYTEPAFSWKYAVAPSPLGFARGAALGAQYADDLFVGASRTTLLGGYLFRLNLSDDRTAIATDDPRLSDRVADNADKFDLAESESLLVGRDFGVTTDIQTGPDGRLYVVSLSRGAVYQIFSPSAPNPVDESTFFVRQHYRDFLSRDPEPAGLQFWTNEIELCGTDQRCREVKRVNVSAAFFLSIEFQETGYLAYRLYETAFDRQPRYLEFLADTRELGRDVIVGVGDWRQRLEANKRAFADAFVQRPDFRAAFDPLANAQYVDKLFANAGVAPVVSERDALVNGLDNGTETRAAVLRKVADDARLRALEFNRAFVLMQYFGYLRRNPDDPPDANRDGYNFWLAKLDQFGGDFVRAEMVRAFINSIEYRRRFGP